MLSAGPVSAAQEGVRDCGDVKSRVWLHSLGPSPDDLYFGDQWFVYGGIGVQPRCSFAKKWAQAVIPKGHDAGTVFNIRIKNGPPGWKCTFRNFDLVVDTTGGMLACTKYKNRKVVGSFTSGPDFNTQTIVVL